MDGPLNINAWVTIKFNMCVIQYMCGICSFFTADLILTPESVIIATILCTIPK